MPLLRKMGAASETGVDKVITAAAKHASDKAPVRSGDLRDDIKKKGVERVRAMTWWAIGAPICPMRCRFRVAASE